MIELDNAFSNGKTTDYNWDAILDLDRLIPCVEGGRVIERTAPDSFGAVSVRMSSFTFASFSITASSTFLEPLRQ